MNSGKKLIFPLIFSFILSVIAIPSATTDSVPVVATAEPVKVVPGGKSIGVILSTDGVLVVELSEFEDKNGNLCCPAKEAGIKPGDVIRNFNDTKIADVTDLSQAISDTKGENFTLTLSRNNKKLQVSVSPKETANDSQAKIGALVKDAASGIGTITFYNPETNYFSALGHGICDSKSGKIISVDNGEILSSTIVSVDKSEKGTPGELNGVFSENDQVLGKIEENNEFGIRGILSDNFSLPHAPIPVAEKEAIKTGNAYILANIEGNLVEKFEIEVLRILSLDNTSSKNMIIKITDEKLIEKTGGIVQGMSGSPIIQDGKLIGAVTHVFVNDPTRGYGIFIENMLAKVDKTE